MKDVAASHEALIHLFERIHLFLQRLNRYTGMPLTGDMTELLGKIMSQVLSILALSTKKMMDRRISELDFPLCRSSMTNYTAENILKKLAGRTDVEDAVLRLDTLTNEESLMVVVRNLEVTHRVDENVEATKVLTEDIDGNVKVIDHDLKTTKDSTQRLLLAVFVHADFPLCANIVSAEVKRSFLLSGAVVERQANMHPQETRCKRNSDLGYLLLTLPSIITLRAKFSIVELQRGLSKGTHFGNGCRKVLSCGFVAIVSWPRAPSVCLLILSRILSGCGEEYPLVRGFSSILMIENSYTFKLRNYRGDQERARA